MWELVSFASSPTDHAEAKDSEYANIRAMMYYHCNTWLQNGGVIDARDPDWLPDIRKQLSWTKGTRHKTTGKKLAEPKLDIKLRVGQSPDIADGLILGFARVVPERLADNMMMNGEAQFIGGTPYIMPDYDPYANEDLNGLYD
jgi:hypothetical protein